MTSDSEPADFYEGRGESATYLGSRLNRGAPWVLNPWHMFQSRNTDEYTDETYRDIVYLLRDVVAWPHAHSDSADTAWSYCWEKGTVYVYHHGVEAAQIRANTHSWQAKRERLEDGREVVLTSGREFRPKRAHRFPRLRPPVSS